MKLWYLSFVKDGKFAGGAFVYSKSATEAILFSWTTGINPGGDVAFGVVDPSAPCRIVDRAWFDANYVGKFMTREELDRLDEECKRRLVQKLS